MLVVMVPFLTYSQKRTKKGTDTKTETKDKSSNAKVNFMIIKGVEATQEIAKSPNSKVIVIGNGDGDLPIILGGQ